MTRKHLEALAKALYKSMPPTDDQPAMVQWEETFHAIISEIEPLNANFDLRKFSIAAGRITQ